MAPKPRRHLAGFWRSCSSQPHHARRSVARHRRQPHSGARRHYQAKKTYYWYGEQRRQGLDPKLRYVSCYSSDDLVNWKFRGDVVKMLPPDSLSADWILERPKVFYNAKTKKYVLYFHLDDKGYKVAQVGVAVSDQPTGPFQYVKRFRPLGSRAGRNEGNLFSSRWGSDSRESTAGQRPHLRTRAPPAACRKYRCRRCCTARSGCHSGDGRRCRKRTYPFRCACSR